MAPYAKRMRPVRRRFLTWALWVRQVDGMYSFSSLSVRYQLVVSSFMYIGNPQKFNESIANCINLYFSYSFPVRSANSRQCDRVFNKIYRFQFHYYKPSDRGNSNFSNDFFPRCSQRRRPPGTVMVLMRMHNYRCLCSPGKCMVVKQWESCI